MPQRPPGKDVVKRKASASPLRGQQDLYGKPLKPLKLNDKIPPDVHTIFVGVNPGIRSASIGHYYAGHSNYFWKLLHASGIWDTPLTTEDDDKILVRGFGLTDVAKRPTPGVSGLSRADFLASKDRIREIARASKPRTIVFVSLTAARAYLGNDREKIECGLQEWKIEGCDVWVVPSTSGASQGHTSYKQKLAEFRKLCNHINTYYTRG